MPEVKELYKAKSLQELKEQSALLQNQATILTKSYNQAYQKAKRCYDEGIMKEKEGDEEVAFIYFWRSCEIALLFAKCKDKAVVTKDAIMRGRNLFDSCLKRAENIENSLNRRYQFRKEEEEAIEREAEERNFVSPEKEVSVDNLVGRKDVTPEEVYQLLHSLDRPQILVLDIRSDTQSSFRVDNDNFRCAFVTPSLLRPGCTAMKLENNLPISERVLFQRRYNVEYVVLMDENGSSQSLSAKNSLLRILCSAVTDYDQKGTLRRPPLVLEGGFRNWKLHYPMFVEKDGDLKEGYPDSASLDSGYASDVSQVNYPDLEEYFAQKPPSTKEELIVDEHASFLEAELPEPSTGLHPMSSEFLPTVPLIPSRNLKPHLEPRIPIHLASETDHSSLNPLPSGDSGTYLNESSSEIENFSAVDRGETDSEVSTAISTPQTAKNAKPTFDRSMKPTAINGGTELGQNEADSREDEIQERMDSAVSRHIFNGERLDSIAEKLKGLDLSGETEQKEDGSFQPTEPKSSEAKSGLESFAQAKQKSALTPSGLESFAQTKTVLSNCDPVSVNHSVPRTTPVGNQNPTVPDRRTKPENKVKSVPVVDDRNEFLQQIALLRRDCVVGRTELGLTGLFNMGNTCYMNSVIQCLSNTVQLSQYFLSRSYVAHLNRENRFGTKGKLTTSFAALLYELNSGKNRAVRPRPFRDTVLNNTRLFRLGKQEDAQEFLNFLLEGIHEDLNQVRLRVAVPEQNNTGENLVREGNMAWENQHKFAKSYVHQLFEGQLISTVRCKFCDARSYTFDTFNQIHLELPGGQHQSTLEECLQIHLRRETLSGDARWKCPKCRCLRDAEKKIDFWRMPPLLIIHLKRFESRSSYHKKMDLFVDFPMRDLNMEKFVHPASMSGRDYIQRNYHLYAVSNHFGEMGGGHYTAQCFNPRLNRWFQYDDETVSQIPESRVQTDKVYILFYVSAGRR